MSTVNSPIDPLHDEWDIYDYRMPKEDHQLEHIKYNDNEVITRDSFWYLCTPYTQLNKEKAWQDACRMSAYLQDNDYFIFSPVAHFHGMHNFSDHDKDYEFWMKNCFDYVHLSRGLIVCELKGWEASKGIAREVKLAIDLKLPVCYTPFLELPNV